MTNDLFIASTAGSKRSLIVVRWTADGGARAEIADLRGGIIAHRATWTDPVSGAGYDYGVFIDDPGIVSGLEEDAGPELVMRLSAAG